MKRCLPLLLAVSIGLGSWVVAQDDRGDDPDTVATTGILSYIENLPDPANDEGLVRKVPFV